MPTYKTRIIADGDIGKLRAENPVLADILHVMNDDLQQTKLELIQSKFDEVSGFFVRLHPTRGYEPAPVNLEKSLGIGTYAPKNRLHVIAYRDTEDGVNIEVNGDSRSLAPFIRFRRSRSLFTNPEATLDLDHIGKVEFFAADSAGDYKELSQIRGIVHTITGADNISGDLEFRTRPNGAAAAIALRHGIDKDGNVYVGNKTAQLATTATNGFLHIPSCDGMPTGVPTQITGVNPMVFDSRNLILYVYDFIGAAWVAV